MVQSIKHSLFFDNEQIGKYIDKLLIWEFKNWLNQYEQIDKNPIESIH